MFTEAKDDGGGGDNWTTGAINRAKLQSTLLLLLAYAKSHMLSASRRQPHLLHVSAVDRRQTWSMDKS